jgi:hypothetical protein
MTVQGTLPGSHSALVEQVIPLLSHNREYLVKVFHEYYHEHSWGLAKEPVKMKGCPSSAVLLSSVPLDQEQHTLERVSEMLSSSSFEAVAD